MKKKSKLNQIIDLLDKCIWEMALINDHMVWAFDEVIKKIEEIKNEENSN